MSPSTPGMPGGEVFTGLHSPEASGAVSSYSTQLGVLPVSLSVKHFGLFCYTVLSRQEASVISSACAEAPAPRDCWHRLGMCNGFASAGCAIYFIVQQLSVPPTMKCCSKGISEGLCWHRWSRLMPRCHIWEWILHLQCFLFTFTAFFHGFLLLGYLGKSMPW